MPGGLTRSSAIAQEPRDALCELKSCQQLNSCAKSRIWIGCSRWINILYIIYATFPKAWEDSNSRSNLEGHARSLVMVPIDRPHTMHISLPLQLYLPCTVSEMLYIYELFHKVKDVMWLEHIIFGGNLSFMHSAHQLWMPSFTYSKDMIGANF